MVHLQPDAESAVRLSASMIVLATFAVALRLFARTKIISAAGVEDALISLALCLFWAYEGVFLAAIADPGSAGTLDYYKMPLPQLDEFFKYTYIFEILFVFTITTIKISILCFYCHIFSVQSFRQKAYAMGAICMLWFLIALFVLIFQCSPVRAAWHLELQATPGAATCLQSGRIIFGLEISNVIIDISILCLPVYMIRRLQMRTAKKIGVTGIFLLGGFVCVTCIVRAYFAFDPATGDPVSLAGLMNWTTVELATAIICACFPTYGPLFSHSGAVSRLNTWFASLLSSMRISKSPGQQQSSRLSEAKFTRVQSDTSRRYEPGGQATDQHPLTDTIGNASSSERGLSEDAFRLSEVQAKNANRMV